MSGLISNGSYVLGDPNTRDLYLGKGLKDGFEGDKYYIAADETVLWEGEASSGSIQLSENYDNFEFLEFYITDSYRPTVTTIHKCVTSSKVDVMRNIIIGDTNTGTYAAYGQELDLSNTTVTFRGVRGFSYSIPSGTTSITISKIYGNDTVKCKIVKVIGINRKRG